MTLAELGHRVVLIDLDPRAVSTEWTAVEPIDKGMHVGAIIAAEEGLEGAVEALAVQTTWHENLRVLPSAASVSNREADNTPYAELRLKKAIEGVNADFVIIDCPNRQGGVLTRSALSAADKVIYAAKPDEEGWKGYLGAKSSVDAFKEARRTMGAESGLQEVGIVVSGMENIPTRVSKVTIERMESTGQLLRPYIPKRVVVQEARLTNEWYGDYEKGAPVVDAYSKIVKQVIA